MRTRILPLCITAASLLALLFGLFVLLKGWERANNPIAKGGMELLLIGTLLFATGLFSLVLYHREK
ncbi:MAG TPA: hypothetical protein VHK69_12055 [Chitinophagaceae bacterium]|jgi:hypothetical protein|nr:hypothetical protein [Chitinophagaceae bacterium]